MLNRIVKTLEQKTEQIWAGLSAEFCANGVLKTLFKEIEEKGGYPVHKFINQILLINLAFTFMDVMLA